MSFKLTSKKDEIIALGPYYVDSQAQRRVPASPSHFYGQFVVKLQIIYRCCKCFLAPLAVTQSLTDGDHGVLQVLAGIIGKPPINNADHVEEPYVVVRQAYSEPVQTYDVWQQLDNITGASVAMASSDLLSLMQQKIWEARIPLEIRMSPAECRSYDRVEPYLIAFPRLSYLPGLLPRLLDFFSPHLISDAATIVANSGQFTYENVPLKWHFPLGLLYDIHVLSIQQADLDDPSRSLSAFKLMLHFSSTSSSGNLDQVSPAPTVVNDAFINSVKEADFLRSGTAKPIMSLSAADSRALWSSTQENDLSTFSRIHNVLLPSLGRWRNIPLRVFIPSSNTEEPAKAQIKVIQGQFPPTVTAVSATTASQLRGAGGGQQQSLGTALHSLLPSLFPSRRTTILAKPILHGAVVPMNAALEDLARKCCYADGWIGIVVAMTN